MVAGPEPLRSIGPSHSAGDNGNDIPTLPLPRLFFALGVREVGADASRRNCDGDWRKNGA